MCESNSTLEKAAEWLFSLFQAYKYPKHRFIKLMKTAVVDVEKTQSREEFYQQIVDLDTIGEYCSKIGLTRRTVLDFSQIHIDHRVSNGLFIELFNYFQSEKLSMTHLLAVLTTLDPQCPVKDTKSLSSLGGKLKQQFQLLNKSKRRNENAGLTFKDEILSVKSDVSQPSHHRKTNSNATKSKRQKTSHRHSTNSEVNKDETLLLQIATLNEVINEKKALNLMYLLKTDKYITSKPKILC